MARDFLEDQHLRQLKQLKRCHLLATYSLPKQVVSDNGPQCNRVKHICCVPYHPSSNETVERFNQTFKQALKASEKDGHSTSRRSGDFLLCYRSMPHSTLIAHQAHFLLRELKNTIFMSTP